MDLRSVREEFEAKRSLFERLKEKSLYVLDKERKKGLIIFGIFFALIGFLISVTPYIRKELNR